MLFAVALKRWETSAHGCSLFRLGSVADITPPIELVRFVPEADIQSFIIQSFMIGPSFRDQPAFVPS